MTKLIVNIGNTADDRRGDPIRIAFDKINQNFTELYGNLTNAIPTVTGNGGKILSTDGVHLTWIDGNLSNAILTINNLPPTNPTTNNLWYDTISGRIYVYYNSNWTDASPPIANYKPIPPTTSRGAYGDMVGYWSANSNYYYYCAANYTGNGDDIWRRVAFDGLTW
jgi:hypothetical protein